MTFRQTAIKAAKEAGKIQLKYFGNIKDIKYKDKTNAVTNADLEADDKILKIIKGSFPDHNILSEESGAIGKGSEYKWLIDPLDGTHNYMHNLPLFGISIALEYKKEIVLGVIYLPYFDSLYVAERGKGAFLNDKRIKVSGVEEFGRSMIFLDGGLHRELKNRFKLVSNLAKDVHKMRVMGVAVIDFVYVAEGRIEASILFPTNPWDIAAGILIVKEAGGKVTDFEGKMASPYSNKIIISNGKVHEKVLRILSK